MNSAYCFTCVNLEKVLLSIHETIYFSFDFIYVYWLCVVPRLVLGALLYITVLLYKRRCVHISFFWLPPPLCRYALLSVCPRPLAIALTLPDVLASFCCYCCCCWWSWLCWSIHPSTAQQSPIPFILRSWILLYIAYQFVILGYRPNRWQNEDEDILAVCDWARTEQCISICVPCVL